MKLAIDKAYEENLALYKENDPNRKRFALHNLIADLMAIATDNGVELDDLMIEGVDMFQQRGNDLVFDGPMEFFAHCSKKAW